MSKRNRVSPTGAIVAADLTCEWMGNRGCLHEGETIVRPWRSRAWITCQTEFRGRRVQQWAPGRYTVLFFHDEAVALAAGHRPCGECRRGWYARFLDAWERAHGERPSAKALDATLHAARLDGSEQRTHRLAWPDVPFGAFVSTSAGPALVGRFGLVSWSELGYTGALSRPTEGEATVLTPAPTVAAMRAGYRPQVHLEAVNLLGPTPNVVN